MNEELTPQKERFLREVEQKLLRKELDATLREDGLIHVRWNEKPLCSVDRDGIVRFRPADITGAEVDRQLRTVTQTAAQVKEYMRIFECAPALKAVGLEDTYKVLADFGDAVLAGRLGKKGANFVTWEWDFDRQGVHAGHYFMENYEAAKQDFAVRAGLVESQRLFSDEQLAVIKNACEFALEDDATLSYAEEKQLHSVQKQIERLLPQQERNQHPTIESIRAPDCPALLRMTNTMANVDELDWLGKQLESFDRYELLQFNAAVERFGLSAADELIDLSFCANEMTVISDFSDLERVGRKHYLTVHGACDSEELENLDGKETALALIFGQPGYVTQFGVVYDNGVKLEQE